MSNSPSLLTIHRRKLSSYGGQSVVTDVVTPACEAELSRALRDALKEKHRVSFRAGGRSFDTQSLNDVRVISLAAFDHIGEPNAAERCITVGASARWRCILRTTTRKGLVPYVMVTSSNATAGGTLSADCLSRFSPSCGKEGVYVRSFKFMGMDGVALECSRTSNADLFKAVIAGLGCLGAVFEITYELMQLDYEHPNIAVKTTLTPFSGLTHLASMLVDRVIEAQTDLCNAAPSASAHPGAPHAAAATIAAARAMPHEVRAISAVLFLNDQRQGLLTASSYTDARKTPLKRCVLHRPHYVVTWLLQIAALFEKGRKLGWWWVLKRFGKPEEFVDELYGYTFFQDGNEALHRVGRRCGIPLTTLQQTYVVRWDPADPAASSQRLHAFLDAADKLLDARKLTPALIDVLYVPDDAGEGFLLSSSLGLSGFAVTFTFEKLWSSDVTAEQDALRAIAVVCAQGGGRVHLVKHVYADAKLLDEMYEEPLTQMIELRHKHGATETIRNDFLKRVFPRLLSEKPATE